MIYFDSEKTQQGSESQLFKDVHLKHFERIFNMETLVVACLIAAVVVFILDMVFPKVRVSSKEHPNDLKWVAMGCITAAGKKTFII